MTSVFMWVGVVSSLVIYSMANNDPEHIQSTYEAINAEETIST